MGIASASFIKAFNIVWLALTYKCNNRCIWCYAGSKNVNNHIKNLSSLDEDSIISLLVDLGIKKIVLIGGEPTLFKGIERIIEKLSRNNFSIYLITNGRRLKNIDFALRLKDKGLTHVGISIEGSCPDIHDSITQVSGSFNDTVRGLQNSLDVGLKTYSNTTISLKNINDLGHIRDLVFQFGIKTISFNICGQCISDEHNHVLSPLVASEAFKSLYLTTLNKDIRITLLTAIPLCFFEPFIREELQTSNAIHGGPCQMAHGKSFVIDYNGDVIPCTHLTGNPLFNVFNDADKIVSAEKFIEIYNDPQRIPFQFRNAMRRYPSNKCRRSLCSEDCSGCCPLFWTGFNPENEIIGNT